MSNKKIQGYYGKLAGEINCAQQTRNKAPDFSQYDIAYMQEFLNPQHSLLDLGAGSGLLLNHIKNGFKKVVAVELYPEFSRFILPAENTLIINTDIMKFKTSETFNVVILFGVMNFFSTEEAQTLYKKFFGFVKPGGILIVKNQMGIDADVRVDNFSEELQQNYYSEYRCVSSETSLMSEAGFAIDRVDDVYPDSFNRWANTRFTAILCRKKLSD